MKKSLPYIIVLSVTAILGAVYFIFDPEVTRFMPRCLFHELTGLQCPGCGSQRMLHALLHGNIGEAWHHNALLLCLLPLIIPMIWLEINRRRYPGIYMRVHSIPVMIIIISIIIAWWIARNI